MYMKDRMPCGDKEKTRVGGTQMGASNRVGSAGEEPDSAKTSIKAMNKGSSKKGEVSDSVLSTKKNKIGGMPMGK